MEAQKSSRKFRHQRKKQELEYLRKQVCEPEKEVEDLKTFRVGGADSQRAVLLPEGGESSKDVSLWERVARNQRSDRVKAEVENGNLRQRLEGQLKLAQGLQKLLRKRPADEDLEGEANQKMRARKLSTLQEPQIFEILNGQVDGLYSRIDAIMNDAGLAVLKRECNGAQVKIDGFGRLCVKMVDARISPFAMHNVAKAAWTMLGTKRIELESGYYKALECTHDTVRAEYCVMLRLRRDEALVRMQILGRRIVEEERVVWATLGQTEGAPFDKHSIHLSERGWTVVKSLKYERSADGGGTITQSCVRLIPELNDEPGQLVHTGVLSDLVIHSYGLNMQTLHQEVENCLLRAE